VANLQRKSKNTQFPLLLLRRISFAYARFASSLTKHDPFRRPSLTILRRFSPDFFAQICWRPSFAFVRLWLPQEKHMRIAIVPACLPWKLIKH
jgi:hypothetical protein